MLAVSALGSAPAAIIISDDFTYPNGILTEVGTAKWKSGAVTGSGAINVVDGKLVMTATGGNVAVFAANLGSNLSGSFVGFDLTVLGGPGTDGSRNIFAGLSTDVDASMNRGSVDIRQWSDTTFDLKNNAAPNLDFTTTYRVVSQWSASVNETYWVATYGNLAQETTYYVASAGGGSSYDSFYFRDTGKFGLEIDNFVIATTWSEAAGAAAVPEPAFLAGLGGVLSLLAAFWRRRS